VIDKQPPLLQRLEPDVQVGLGADSTDRRIQGSLAQVCQTGNGAPRIVFPSASRVDSRPSVFRSCSKELRLALAEACVFNAGAVVAAGPESLACGKARWIAMGGAKTFRTVKSLLP